jgi:hypothetical protein
MKVRGYKRGRKTRDKGFMKLQRSKEERRMQTFFIAGFLNDVSRDTSTSVGLVYSCPC